MSRLYSNTRFTAALEAARADWAAADAHECARQTGCEHSDRGVIVPFFGRPYLVGHPDGQLELDEAATGIDGAPRHPGDNGEPGSVALVLLHHLLCADGSAAEEGWLAFRELPDGMFYAQAFTAYAEAEIGRAFGGDAGAGGDHALGAFAAAAAGLGATPVSLGDAAFRLQVFPRLALAVLVWLADDEFAGQGRILFERAAPHYLPTEDLAIVGDWLAASLGGQAPAGPTSG